MLHTRYTNLVLFFKFPPNFEPKTKDNVVCFVQLHQALFKQFKFEPQLPVVCCFKFILKWERAFNDPRDIFDLSKS